MTIDVAAREIRLESERVAVEPRAFDLLSYLIAHRDRAVPKDELIDEVWRGRVVTDGVLYRSVKLVREALSPVGDDLVRTVHRVGYRFMGDVTELTGDEMPADIAGFLVAIDSAEFDAFEDAEGGVALEAEVDGDVRLMRFTDSGAALALVTGVQAKHRGVRVGVHYGLAAGDGPALAAEIAGIALPDQILMSAAAFEQFRTYGPGKSAPEIDWLAHGPYRFVESGVVTSLFEAGVRPYAPMREPPDSTRAHRSGAEDVILGWRAAPDQSVPGRDHWLLTECLGEGGFGEAWLAMHAKTRERRVFKFCYRADRLRSLQREVTLFRLLNETLGSRPDIARILDWNFDTAPYFVESEFSESGDLLQWSEERGGIASVPMEQRLQLMASVADALSAAHSVGVLHKDVKPANILIREPEDREAQPMLADFGVGLIADRQALDDLNITRLGLSETATEIQRSSRSGTRRYMAPEVLEGRPPSIQADIYSLGVVLYQVIVGDFSRVLAPGWERDIEDPILCEDVAAMVDGDPTMRVGDAGVVATRLRQLDSRRHRRQEEELAKRRREKERARRRVLIPAALLGSALLAVLAVQNYRIGKERERAEVAAAAAQREAAKASSVANFMNDLFDAANPLYQSETPTVVDFLELGAARIETELAGQPAVRAELERTLGRAFNALGDFENAGALLTKSIEDATTAGDAEAEVRARIARAGLHNERAEFDASTLQLDSAQERVETLSEPLRSDLLSLVTATRARALYQRQSPSEAAVMLGEAIRMRRSVLPEPDEELAKMQSNRAGYLAASGGAELEEIATLYEDAIAVFEVQAPESFNHFQTLGDYARHLSVMGRHSEAQPLLRRALAYANTRLGATHRHTAGLQFLLGRMITDFDEAHDLLTESLATRQQLFGDHVVTSLGHWALAELYQNEGRSEAAVESARLAHEMRRRVVADNPGALAETAGTYGTALYVVGQYAASLEVLDEAMEWALQGPGPDHWLTASVRRARVTPLIATGRLEEALAESQEALRVLRQRYGPETDMLQTALLKRAEVLIAAGSTDEASDILAQLESHVDTMRNRLRAEFGRLRAALTLPPAEVAGP